ADGGGKAAATLRDYYQSLTDDVETTLELESFLSSLRGVPLDADEEQELVDTMTALASRAAAADRLAAAYASLGTLAGSDAPELAATAGRNLATALAGVTRLPQGVDPAPLVGSVAGDVARAVESHELSHANRALLSAITAAERLFSQEIGLYRGIVEERGDKVGAVEEALLGAGLLDTSPLLQQLAGLTGLPLAAGARPDATISAALSDYALTRSERHTALSAAAAESVEASLLAQIEAQTALEQRRAPSLGEVDAAVSRAATYLGEIAALRREVEAAGAGTAAASPASPPAPATPAPGGTP
ncbi:MAG TPA: hypothetical protein VHM02_15690, partial [Thermoanaerobaculia bacterium]|nr:hypothetical protein [Thermoanaerobaculia bacterium]